MSPEYTESLTELRAEIDRLDTQLATLLADRMGIIHKVAALKAAHTPGTCHIRPGREGMMHRRITERFAGSDFPAPAALGVWRQIIGASTHLESPIRIAAASQALLWQGRDYFSRMAVPCPTESAETALEAVKQQTATIALLPPPTPETLSFWASWRAQHPELYVFAALPVVLAPGESPAAYAVAAVRPEASGDDVSLFALAASAPLPQGAVVLASNAAQRIIQCAGFITELAQAHYLGTLPRPLTDSTLTPWPNL